MAAKSSISVSLVPARGGFLDRVFLGKFTNATTKASFQAAGETMRDVAKRRMPAAKRVRMSAAQKREQQWPPDRPMFAANPAPNMPAIRLKKGAASPFNLSRPWYSPDNDSRPSAMFIGPPKGAKPARRTVPAILDQGGRVRKNSRMRRRRVGHGGEIRTDGKPSRTNRLIENDFGATVTTTYIKLRTPRQARRANLIQRQLFKPPTIINLPPRRYMSRIAREAMRSPEYRAKQARLIANWRRTGVDQFRLRRSA